MRLGSVLPAGISNSMALRAISILVFPSTFPHMLPEASSTRMTRVGGCAPCAASRNSPETSSNSDGNSRADADMPASRLFDQRLIGFSLRERTERRKKQKAAQATARRTPSFPRSFQVPRTRLRTNARGDVLRRIPGLADTTTTETPATVPLWRDDYSNLFGIVKW